MTRLMPLMLLTLLLTALPAQAAAPLPKVQDAGAIIVDGRLDEAAWEEAATFSDFKVYLGNRFGEAGGEPVRQTRVQTWYDDSALYVAFQCEEPATAELRTDADEPGRSDRRETRWVSNRYPMAADDYVEAFLIPGSEDGYIYFRVTAAGELFTERITRAERDMAWQGDLQHAVHLTPGDGWTVEVAIPWHAVAQDVADEPWRIHFGRYVASALQISSHPFVTSSRYPFFTGIDPTIFPLEIEQPDVDFDSYPNLKLGNIRVRGVEMISGAFVYTINGAIQSDRDLNAALAAEITTALGKTTPLAVTLEAGQQQPFSCRVTTKELVHEPKLLVRLVDQDTGRPLHVAGYGSEVFPGGARLLLDRNYYTTEPVATAVFDTAIEGAARQWTGRATLNVNGERRDFSTTARPGEPLKIDIDLSDIPVGTHPVTLALHADDSRIVAMRRLDLIKKAPAPEGVRVVQIDHENLRVLVDGEPFFPIGVMGVPADHMQQAADAGFNMTMRWRGYSTWRRYDPAKPLEEQRELITDYLDAAAAHNLLVFEAPNKLNEKYFTFKDGSFLEEYPEFHENVLPHIMQVAAQHTAVIGYYSYDEPYGWAAPGMNEFGRLVREMDPYRLPFVLFDAYVPDWPEAYDLAGRDYYPRVDTPLANVYHVAQDEVARLAQWNLPLIYMPLFEGSSGRPEPMSGEVQRAQTYLALTAGVKGILWWVWPANCHDNWQAIQQLAAEMNALQDVLLSKTPDHAITYTQLGTADLLKAIVKHHNGKTYFITVNATPHTLHMIASLPSELSHEGRVMFEQRELPAILNKLGDTFEPYARHVYEIDGDWPRCGEIELNVSILKRGETSAPVALPEPTGDNLVVNASFEEDFSHTPGWPLGWYPTDSIMTSGAIGGDNAIWGATDEDAQTGERSLKLEKTTGEEGQLVSDVAMYYFSEAPAAEVRLPELEAGKTYTASAWLKAARPGTRAWLYVGWEQQHLIELTDQWQRYEFPAAFEKLPRKLFLRFYLPEKGAIWIDDVRFSADEAP